MCEANFGYIVRKKSRYDAGSTAIVEQSSGASFTYSDLEDRSNRVARALEERGVGPGDTVTGLFRNSIEFFDVFFGAAKLGAMTAPLNFRLTPTELEYLLDDSAPSVFFYESVFEDKVTELPLEDVTTIRIGDEEESGFDAEPYSNLLDTVVDDPPEIRGAFDDPVVLLYTSGSTGRPKGVPLSHKNVFFSSVSYVVDTGLDQHDTIVTSSPVFHVGGLNILTLPVLHVGGEVILQQEFVPEETWEIMEERNVTKMFAIPTMLNSMVKVGDWQRHDLDSLDLVIAGGEPVPTELKEVLQEIDVPVVAAYGLTETTDGTLFLRPEDAIDKGPKCNGKTFTHVDAKVVDEDGREAEPGEAGELLHRGPTVADGYLNRPDATEEAWDGEWFHTGDIAAVDEDGYYHIYGRKDNMIITGGENVYPSEVEEALYSHSAVKEAVVFGTESDRWGEAVTTVVATEDDLDASTLKTFLEGRLANFKHPKRWKFVKELPKSGTGKIERRAVVESFEMETAGSS